MYNVKRLKTLLWDYCGYYLEKQLGYKASRKYMDERTVNLALQLISIDLAVLSVANCQ